MLCVMYFDCSKPNFLEVKFVRCCCFFTLQLYQEAVLSIIQGTEFKSAGTERPLRFN